VLDIKQFETIKKKHGGYASWAVWADTGEKPKSNMGDISIFDLEANKTLLDILRNDVIMVGLNISRSFAESFRNFHDSNPRANDYKIRYAFQNTAYYGAYMTDLIKNFEMVDSNDVRKHLKANPALIEKSIDKFREEMQDLKYNRPVILAFGAAVYKIINENVRNDEYSKLIKLTHYSHQINKEKFKETVLNQIAIGTSCTNLSA